MLIFSGVKDGIGLPEGLVSADNEGRVCERGMREGRGDDSGVARDGFGVILGEGGA